MEGCFVSSFFLKVQVFLQGGLQIQILSFKIQYLRSFCQIFVPPVCQNHVNDPRQVFLGNIFWMFTIWKEKQERQLFSAQKTWEWYFLFWRSVFWITDVLWLYVPCKEQKQGTHISARIVAKGFCFPPPSPQRVQFQFIISGGREDGTIDY